MASSYLLWYLFPITWISWWKRSPCSSLTSVKFGLKKSKYCMNANSVFLLTSCIQACSMIAVRLPQDLHNYRLCFFQENHAQLRETTAKHLFLNHSFCLLIPWSQALFVESGVLWKYSTTFYICFWQFWKHCLHMLDSFTVSFQCFYELLCKTKLYVECWQQNLFSLN